MSGPRISPVEIQLSRMLSASTLSSPEKLQIHGQERHISEWLWVLRARVCSGLLPEFWRQSENMNPMAIADSGASREILPMTEWWQVCEASQFVSCCGWDCSSGSSSGDLCRAYYYTFVSTRKSDTQASIDRDLDPQDFDIELCEQVGYWSWLDAMPTKMGYTLLHSNSALDVTTCFANAVQRSEDLSTTVL